MKGNFGEFSSQSPDPCKMSKFLIKPHLNFKQLSRSIPETIENIRKRNVNVDATKVIDIYEQFCKLNEDCKSISHERNLLADKMAVISLIEKEKLQTKAIQLKEQLKINQNELKLLQDEMIELAFQIPNDSHPETPSENKQIDFIGDDRNLKASAMHHLDIGKSLDILDFDAGARTSGSRFFFLKNEGALLELNLINYVMGKCIEKGFTPILPPDLVQKGIVSGCGFRPRLDQVELDDQIYSVAGTDLCLSATAEIPLMGMHADTILDSTKFPIKMAAFNHCFRAEAGSYGAESRGLYRVHQFSKVELAAITFPEHSNELFEEIVSLQKEIISSLGFSARVLNMAHNELGNSAHRKIDIEAWFPERKDFGEITSASNCTDYQSRRLNIRYKTPTSNAFVHTLNGTACAIPRVIQLILENNQLPDGSVSIPECLQFGLLKNICKIKK